MSSVFLRQYTVKRVDKKLRQPDRMKQYSSIRGMEHFFDMQIELIRRFATMKTKYFEAQGYSLFMHSAEFFYHFPFSRVGVFRQMNQNHSVVTRTPTYVLQYYNPLLYHCATLTVFSAVRNVFRFVSTLFTFVNTVFLFISAVLSFVSNVLTFVSTVFSFVSTLFTFVNTVFFFVSTVLIFVSTVFSFVSTLSLRQYCVFLRLVMC
jgi:hypothetical protein